MEDDAATSAVVAAVIHGSSGVGMSQEELMMRQEEVLRLDELERAASSKRRHGGLWDRIRGRAGWTCSKHRQPGDPGVVRRAVRSG